MAKSDEDETWCIGNKVIVCGFSGTIRFIGDTEFAPGTWLGLEMDQGIGKNDGSVKGTRYFSCRDKHGLFVRQTVVKAANEPDQLEGARQDESTDPANSAEHEAVRKTSIVSVDSVDSDGDDDTADLPPMVSKRSIVSRRCGVSAEDSHASNEDTTAVQSHQKSAEQCQQLRDIIVSSKDIKLKIMFGGLSTTRVEEVIDAMFLKQVSSGETVIRMGDDGDFFYIVKSGRFDIYAKKIVENDDGSIAQTTITKVFEAQPGFAFGELALLYNAPRSATITASEDSEVWCLDGSAFRKLIVRGAEERFNSYLDFLRGCDLFAELSSDQLAQLAEVLVEEDFEADEVIVQQGERDDKMFILAKGRAIACIRGDRKSVV